MPKKDLNNIREMIPETRNLNDNILDHYYHLFSLDIYGVNWFLLDSGVIEAFKKWLKGKQYI